MVEIETNVWEKKIAVVIKPRRCRKHFEKSHGFEFTQVKKWDRSYSKEGGAEKLSEKSHRIDFTQVNIT
jgi:hypothetical protein